MNELIVRDNDLVLDSLPESVVASMEVRDKFMNNLGLGGGIGFEFLVEDLLRWTPGQTVRIAFLDGDTDLHKDILEAVQEVSDACNLTFDFGDSDNGNFHRWTENDSDYEAEIRISFDKRGYFSLVGTDSANADIGRAFDRVGGRPNQCSMNFGGFAVQKPNTWQRTVKHEFLHALGFHHSHQNMRGPCQEAFRWGDDEGYQPTRNANDVFVSDSAGRRPGIYTFLAGAPNNWTRSKVDHNLRTEEDPNLVASPFDRASVMLYRFPADFYKTIPSPCEPEGEGLSLSAGDVRGLQLLYPGRESEALEITNRQNVVLDNLTNAEGVALESVQPRASSQSSGFVAAAASVLRSNLASIPK